MTLLQCPHPPLPVANANAPIPYLLPLLASQNSGGAGVTSLGSTRVGFADLTTALFPTALDAVVSGDDDFGHGRVVGELRLRAHYQRTVPNQPKLERCVVGLFPLLGCFPSGTADGEETPTVT